MFLFMLENNDVLDVTFVFFNKDISTTNIESYRKMEAMIANVLPQISRLWLQWSFSRSLASPCHLFQLTYILWIRKVKSTKCWDQKCNQCHNSILQHLSLIVTHSNTHTHTQNIYLVKFHRCMQSDTFSSPAKSTVCNLSSYSQSLSTRWVNKVIKQLGNMVLDLLYFIFCT